MDHRRARALSAVIAAPAALWCALALHVDGAPVLGTVLGLALFAGVIACSQRLRLAPIAVVACAGTLAWWLAIPARTDRDWVREHARAPHAAVQGSVARIDGVRAFRWSSATEARERWTSRTIDLDRVVAVDAFVSDWGSRHVAHTIVSWILDDGSPPLAISIEARRERGEEYDPIRGLFRSYELHYVVADEPDVIALRTHHRRESVLLYQLGLAPERARALLRSYLAAIERIERAPRWYHALAGNCSTTTRAHAEEIGIESTWDWRVLANGHVDELFYERGIVDTSMPFDELRRRSEITERARAIPEDAPDFSARLRHGLPARPR